MADEMCIRVIDLCEEIYYIRATPDIRAVLLRIRLQDLKYIRTTDGYLKYILILNGSVHWRKTG